MTADGMRERLHQIEDDHRQIEARLRQVDADLVLLEVDLIRLALASLSRRRGKGRNRSKVDR